MQLLLWECISGILQASIFQGRGGAICHSIIFAARLLKKLMLLEYDIEGYIGIHQTILCNAA